jgi:hypothetical protein
MAAITETRVEVFDTGSGVSVNCAITISVGQEVLVHKLAMVDLALTAPQTATLQSAIDILRNKAITKTKADMVIP